jgi:acylphosphatase
VLVDGRVQGVFFRQSCRREADVRGVSGWVRNRSDGRVEAVFEGTADAVDAMVAWCRRGPAGARVDEVEVADEPVEGASGFRIAPST